MLSTLVLRGATRGNGRCRIIVATQLHHKPFNAVII